MKTRIFFIIIGAIVLLGIGGAIFSSRQSSQDTDPRIAFAQCLSDAGAKFYGAFWCPHCQAQKRAFGSKASKVLPYVECSTADGNSQTQACKDAGVQSYPTWEFPDGTRTTGTKSFQELAEATGCVAPQE